MLAHRRTDFRQGSVAQGGRGRFVGLPIRLAVNPDWPFAHYAGTDVVVGDGMAFIAENCQEGYLPASVRNALAWA